MNRTDRMLAIVLALQAHGSRRAEDLATSFEVSKRTIYRDVQALCEAGVPVVAEPGRGYSLPPGYFLPPLRFSADEALILLLGADVMSHSFDAEYRRAAEAAAHKIAGALPDERRAAVRDLQASLEFVGEEALAPRVAEHLPVLRRAVLAHQTVRFSYRARYGADGSGVETRRNADPYGLVCFAGSWYLVAYCYLRQDRRNFRLDRIEQLEVLPQQFERPLGLTLKHPSEERPLVVRALFAPEVAPWVCEAPNYYTVATETHADGLLVTLRVRRFDEVQSWLLGWGRHVRVLEPPALCALLVAEAQAMVANHTRFPVEPSLLT